MKSDICIIGGGASGLMAAYNAAKTACTNGQALQVTVLEKMPRPGRKIMITGKGRCNFTNIKDWNEFSQHICSKSNFVKYSFQNFTSRNALDFFESFGMKTVVERGDRAFPLSYHASDVVDTLVGACHSLGVKIETEFEVASISEGFEITSTDGRTYRCSRLIIATGGLSYPGTGSTGDGYRWADATGHRIVQTFPALTALVPKGYKDSDRMISSFRCHISRETPLSELGQKFCGIQLKNIQASLIIEGTVTDSLFGDIDFTDGGIEGPAGFQLSRKAVKAMINGSRVCVELDLKPGVQLTELSGRIRELWKEIDKDPRSVRLHEKEKCRILLGKLIPWELIPAFTATNPGIMTLERKGRTDTKVWVNLVSIAKALKSWNFDIAGFVGYERAVVTAGGVCTDDIYPKTMESRLMQGLYFCGEVLDIDSETGGYNLQTAFSTGALAGLNAAKSLF